MESRRDCEGRQHALGAMAHDGGSMAVVLGEGTRCAAGGLYRFSRHMSPASQSKGGERLFNVHHSGTPHRPSSFATPLDKG